MANKHFDQTPYKLSGDQIERILDRVVPLIATIEDRGFFRAILRLTAESMDSSSFAALISKLLSDVK